MSEPCLPVSKRNKWSRWCLRLRFRESEIKIIAASELPIKSCMNCGKTIVFLQTQIENKETGWESKLYKQFF